MATSLMAEDRRLGLVIAIFKTLFLLSLFLRSLYFWCVLSLVHARITRATIPQAHNIRAEASQILNLHTNYKAIPCKSQALFAKNSNFRHLFLWLTRMCKRSDQLYRGTSIICLQFFLPPFPPFN